MTNTDFSLNIVYFKENGLGKAKMQHKPYPNTDFTSRESEYETIFYDANQTW